MGQRVQFNNDRKEYNTYSKNNYQRANLKELNKTMKEARRIVSVGKATAALHKRNLSPNNISESRTITVNNAKLLSNALKSIHRNKSIKRKQAIQSANFNQLLRNINNNRKNTLSNNNRTRKNRKN
jgi:hypothetical protein